MLCNGTIVPFWQQIIEDDFQVLLHVVRSIASRGIMATHHVLNVVRISLFVLGFVHQSDHGVERVEQHPLHTRA